MPAGTGQEMPFTYDPLLVVASVLVAIMAAFTGLRLASGLGVLDPAARKRQIAKAACALGGGIWSMHFVGMLAVRLPVPITYDALYTLGSVLISILITGLGLSLLHLGERNWLRTGAAGTLTGLGIVSMHYVGMEAIGGGCTVSYLPAGFFLSSGIAILASTAALRIAYRRRTLAQLSLAAVVLGMTIASMHYSAMAFTRFMPVEDMLEVAVPVIEPGYLALIVAVAAFVVCGLFLLSALPLQLQPQPAGMPRGATAAAEAPAEPAPAPASASVAEPLRLPYERSGVTYFIDAAAVAAIQAEGHYTRLHHGGGSHFCPWSISRAEEVLAGRGFVRTHRSFLVNLGHARGFWREKDKAFLVLPGHEGPPVPVSRTHLADVRRALGL